MTPGLSRFPGAERIFFKVDEGGQNMIHLSADKNRLTVLQGETLTSGARNVFSVHFTFSADWDGLSRTAIFKAGDISISVLLDGSGTCTIPWEVLSRPSRQLLAGVYGARDGTAVLPPVWVRLGAIQEGAAPGPAAQPPTPGLYEQILAQLDEKADGLRRDGGELQLLAGEKVLGTAALSGAEDQIPADHRLLSHRDAGGQHPIEAISGLDEIANRDILNLWNGGM